MLHLTEIGGKLTLPPGDLMPGQTVHWDDLTIWAELSPHLQLVMSGPRGEVRAPLTLTLSQQHHYLASQALLVAPGLSEHPHGHSSEHGAARFIGVTLERVARRALNLAPLAPLRPLSDPVVDGWPLIVQREGPDQISLLCTHDMSPLIGVHLHQRHEGPEFHILRTGRSPLKVNPRLRPDWTTEQQLAAPAQELNHRARSGWQRHQVLLALAALRSLTECWWATRPCLGPTGERELAHEAQSIPSMNETRLTQLELLNVPCLHLRFGYGPALLVRQTDDLQADLERLISSARGVAYHPRREEWRDMLAQMEALGLTRPGGRPGGVIPAQVVPGTMPSTMPRPREIQTQFWPQLDSAVH